MNTSELIEFLGELKHSEVIFKFENGTTFSPHYHISYISKVKKQGFSCETIPYSEESIEIQLWVANDLDHRISGAKFLNILSKLNLESRDLMKNVIIQLDQNGVLSNFELETSNGELKLISIKASCPAPELCVDKPKVEAVSNQCTPGGGCC